MSDKYAVSNKLPAKSVSILARRKRRIADDQSKVKSLRLNRIKKNQKKKRDFIKAEAFIMEYRKTERDQRRIKQIINNGHLFGVPKSERGETNERLLAVIHFRAHKIANPLVRKILDSFRLSSINTAVLLENNEESRALLKLVQPYVTWGYPTINTVRELIFKHGFMKLKGKSTIINSNQMIEDSLGHLGIICIEDVVHELFTVGANFNTVNNKLMAFKLKAPMDGYKNKTGKHVSMKGEYGNRKAEINEMLLKCM